MAAGYRSETWNAILEDPPELARRGDPEVDAETAYRLYLYLRWCGSVATTERQAEVQFQQFAEEIAGATDESQYVEPGQIAEAEQLALKMQLGRDD